jgi:hypothetical protein
MSQSISFGRDPNGPLRGNKRDVWEGGTRVPFIVRFPGQAAPGLKVSDPVSQVDIFATVAAFLGAELAPDVAPDGESFLNLLRGQQKPSPQRGSLVMDSIRGDLGIVTTDGWKFIDSTGGGNSVSWDSSDIPIPNAAGTKRGVPKQLFHLAQDLGEDHNMISTLTDTAAIRAELTARTGTDLLGVLDDYRTHTTAQLYPRTPDNDADGMPNSFETTYGLDRDNPKDADEDLDGDGATNLAEEIAGTDPTDPRSRLCITEYRDSKTQLDITWPSVAGRRYHVQWSTAMHTWTPDSTHTGTGAPLSATIDKSAIGDPGRLFVRIEVEKD